MAISLKKGQGVSLKKTEYDLSLVTIGLGWDVNEASSGFLKNLLGKKEEDYDLDVVAFMCDKSGKVNRLGEGNSLKGGDVIFYNNMKHSSGTVWLTGDNRTGEGDGDDEQIIVKLNEVPEQYHKIVFVVQIYKGSENNQSFGNVQNAFIRAVDKQNKEMVRFDLSGGAKMAEYRSLLFAELVREESEWKFQAIGNPHRSDTFIEWLKLYVN